MNTRIMETSEAVTYRRIVGFHQDNHGDWVADLECGHARQVRHRPPWINRPWVVSAMGRERHIGTRMKCKRCAEPTNS